MATVEIDGELWDDETGNYLGPVSGWIDGDIDSEEKARVAMRRHLELDTHLAARKAELAIVQANIERLVKDAGKRLEWFASRYGEQLKGFAIDNMPRDKAGNIKTKTWRCPYGTISIRSVAPKVAVIDEGKAIEWAERSCPAAVKIKRSILISEVPAEIKAKMLAKPEAAEQVGFRVVPGEEVVHIKTGVAE